MQNTQQWTVGSTVRVGFLRMVVKAKIPTPGDSMPDAYILANTSGAQLYKWVPFHGLSRIEPDEASQLLAYADQVAQREAERAIAHARRRAVIDALAFQTDPYADHFNEVVVGERPEV